MAARRPHRGRHGRRGKRFGGRTVLYTLEGAFLLGFAAVFVYAFHDFVRNSSSFQVKNVRIEGTRRLDDAVVLAQSGITAQDNVVFFDKGAARARVEAMPYVKRCAVDVLFPDTVTLTVEEREAVATVMVNSRSYALDSEGIVIYEYGPEEMPMAPFLTNVGGLEFVEVGQKLTQPALRAALAVWKALSELSFVEELKVSELSAVHEDDIRMYCDETPYELRWGRGGLPGQENFALQARRLEYLWRDKNGKIPCREYLDLRFDEDLACK